MNTLVGIHSDGATVAGAALDSIGYGLRAAALSN
jgi:hypothetical protein